MTDELEAARLDMILEGLEHENSIRRVQARFDLYSRANSDVEARVGVYHEFLSRLSPYLEFQAPEDEEDEQLSAEEDRKRFVETYRKLVAEGQFKVESPV